MTKPGFSFNRGNLTARLTFMVILTVALTLGIFTTLTAMRLERGAQAQQAAVTKLAWEKMAKQLRLQGSLIESELALMRNQAADAAENLAERQDTVSAIQSGNIVAIDRALQRAVRNSVLDGVIALNADLKVMGSHKPGLDLATTNKEIRGSWFAPAARGLIDANDLQNPKSITRFQPVGPGALKNYGLRSETDMFEVMSLHPVFDGRGDVMSLLLTHRLISGDSPGLVRFARAENLGIRVLQGKKVLLNAGIDPLVHSLPDGFLTDQMGRTQGGKSLYFCSTFKATWKLCVFEPISFLNDLTSSMMSFTKREQEAFLNWLIIFAFASVALATLTTAISTRRVLSPLHQITRVVRSVSKGNWMTHVAGQNRRDEVGEIARAVVMLQASMKERERLLADVADIQKLRDQQKSMSEAAHTCRTTLRQRVFGLSEVVDSIEEQSRKVSSLASLAEGEVDEARLSVAGAFATYTSDQIVDAEGSGGMTPDKVAASTIDRIGETAVEIERTSTELAERIGRMSSEIGRVDGAIRAFMSRLSRGETLDLKNHRISVNAPPLTPTSQAPDREATLPLQDNLQVERRPAVTALEQAEATPEPAEKVRSARHMAS